MPTKSSSFKLGTKTFTKTDMPPEDILSLANAYKNTKISKLVGRTIDIRVNVANDLAKLTGGKQTKAGMQPGNKAMLVQVLKNKLISTDEYKELYRSLVDKHKQVIKYVQNSDPASRQDRRAAKAAARDGRGEFDESVSNKGEQTVLRPLQAIDIATEDLLDNKNIIKLAKKNNVKPRDIVYQSAPHIKFSKNKNKTIKDVTLYLKDTKTGIKIKYYRNFNTGEYINEGVIKEANDEPEVISQLRDIVKEKQYKRIKDPITNKKVKVDLFSAQAILAVYDKLSDKNKKQYIKSPIPNMATIAFKLIK